MSEQKYSYERRGFSYSIYNPEGTKVAEVCGSASERRENARNIVNALNMRNRWLNSKTKGNDSRKPIK